MLIRQLYPEAREVDVVAAAAGLRLGELAPTERPYLVLNMVETLDGKVSIGGRSGPIGNEADRQLFHALREQVDAVMAGAGTIRAERYGRIVRDPERRRRRTEAGLEADPLALVVTASLDLPEDLPLLQDPDSTVVVLTSSEAELPPLPARVAYLRETVAGHAALATQLGELRRDWGVRSILCEGGPRLNETLLRAGLVDELFLSLAPKLAGETEHTLVTGKSWTPPPEFELVSLHEADSHLFMRYRLVSSETPKVA